MLISHHRNQMSWAGLRTIGVVGDSNLQGDHQQQLMVNVKEERADCVNIPIRSRAYQPHISLTIDPT